MNISFVKSVKDGTPTTKNMTWEEFLALPSFLQKEIDLSRDEYLKLSKKEQGFHKDTGGYIGGQCGGKRGKSDILTRSLITLDFDHIGENLEDFSEKLQKTKYRYFLHSTLKSTNDDPRFRLILPLNEEITEDVELKYQAVSRFVANEIGIDYVDSTTFDVNRLMFFPAVLNDQDFIKDVRNGEPVNVEDVLDTYWDWKDSNEWPVKKSENVEFVGTFSGELIDPCDRPSWVGAFCRCYDIHDAIEAFLQDVYEPCKGNRYTYVGASGEGGAIVYDAGAYLYSKHETDPANNGHSVNAYDLVKIHLFENDALAMNKWCGLQEDVKQEYLRAIELIEGKAGADDFDIVEAKKASIDEIVMRLYDINGDELKELCKGVKTFNAELYNQLKNLFDFYNFKTKGMIELEDKILRSSVKSTMIDDIEREHLVEGLLTVGNTTIISAVRGVGKTTLIGDIVHGALKGEPFMGGAFEFKRKVKVLVVISEGDFGDIKEKTDKYDENLEYYVFKTNGLTPEEIKNGIIEIYIKGKGIELVIFDSFSLLISRIPGHGSNDNDAAIKAMDIFCESLTQVGATVLVTMHMSNKSGANTTRGASSIEDLPAYVYYYSQVKSEDRVLGTKLVHSKSRYGDLQNPFYFSLSESGKIIQNAKIAEKKEDEKVVESIEDKEKRLLEIIDSVQKERADGLCPLDEAADRLDGIKGETLRKQVSTKGLYPKVIIESGGASGKPKTIRRRTPFD